MNELNYPASFGLVDEEEMVYITGGTDAASSSTDTPTSTVDYGPMIKIGLIGTGVAIALAVAGNIMMSINEKQLRAKYERETGLSAYGADGNLTNDFKNYQDRANNQGNNKLAQTLDTIGTFMMVPAMLELVLVAAAFSN